MRQSYKLDIERAHFDASSKRHFRHRQFHVAAEFAELGAQHSRRERRGIDFTAKLRPQIDDGADVVFMGMRQDKAHQRLAVFDDEAQVRQNDVCAGFLGSWKGDAEIDHQPLPVILGPKAVEVDVHADFAEATQGHHNEFVAAA